MFSIKSDTHVHFIGIGGIGMSGIAEILLSMGYTVSGSDMSESATVQKLRKLGAMVHIGHDAKNIEGSTVVVYSSAIKKDNPERMQAQLTKIPQMRRAEMLAELMRLKKGIAIAGTHGKTTTTSLLATILKESDYDPTYVIGGIVKNLDGHAKVGTGEFLVAEADESDGSFLLLNPVISLITNIDDDHMEHYETSANYEKAFTEFSNKVPFYGFCSLNIMDERINKMKDELKRPYISFAIDDGKHQADYLAKNVTYEGINSTFTLCRKGKDLGEVTVHLPGQHNVLNSLGAMSIALELGVEFEKVAHAMKFFTGIGRRFQELYNEDNFTVIDDYGHHPTEAASTISALKSTFPDKKKVVVFEPHRFTRTRDCWNDFLHSFNDADLVYFAPIYPASESEIPGITSERLAADINKLHPDLVQTLDSIDDLEKVLKDEKAKGSVVLSLGAGSIGRKVREYVEKL